MLKCPKCSSLVKREQIECNKCGIVFEKYSKNKPIKSYYSSSHEDIKSLEKIKSIFKNYKNLSLIEKTRLLSDAKKKGFLDIASSYINDTESEDKEIILALNKLDIIQKRKTKNTYVSIYILMTFFLIFFILFALIFLLTL